MSDRLDWRSGGVAKSHTVVRQENETVTEFLDRAAAEFEAQLSLFPPD